MLAFLVLAVSVEIHPIADADAVAETAAPASTALAAEAATVPQSPPAPAPSGAVTAVDGEATCKTEEREVFVYDSGKAARKAGSTVHTMRVVFCPST